MLLRRTCMSVLCNSLKEPTRLTQWLWSVHMRLNKWLLIISVLINSTERVKTKLRSICLLTQIILQWMKNSTFQLAKFALKENSRQLSLYLRRKRQSLGCQSKKLSLSQITRNFLRVSYLTRSTSKLNLLLLFQR